MYYNTRLNSAAMTDETTLTSPEKRRVRPKSSEKRHWVNDFWLVMEDRKSFLGKYQESVTGTAWCYTPYDIDSANENRGEWEERILADSELKEILEEELNLGKIAEWAMEIVNRQISTFPACGHYTFPRPLLEIVDAIENQECPDFVISCYTADRQRKKLVCYYVYCLDAWLKNAPVEIATAELQMRDDLGRDWEQILSSIYQTLGETTEARSLVVRRLMHRLRWWIKTLTWFDDKRDRFQLDVYAGDIRGDAKWGEYGNPPFADPYFAELRLPEIQEMTGSIRDNVPEGEGFVVSTEQAWLCGPKVFRYLERLILRIGNIDKGEKRSLGDSILQCEDTYPNLESYRKWYASFMNSLTHWLKGTGEGANDFGETTPVKHWLFRMLRFRLQLLEKHGTFGKLTGAKGSGKTGGERIQDFLDAQRR